MLSPEFIWPKIVSKQLQKLISVILPLIICFSVKILPKKQNGLETKHFRESQDTELVHI